MKNITGFGIFSTISMNNHPLAKLEFLDRHLVLLGRFSGKRPQEYNR